MDISMNMIIMKVYRRNYTDGMSHENMAQCC